MEIHYPIELCRNGIELIDTPGTNDLDQVREEITFNFIPQADAVIFILSATQPLSGVEVDFLKERIIKNDINKIFFVLNFKDNLGDPEVDGNRVTQVVTRELKKFIPNPRIYLLSSKAALRFRRQQSGETVKGDIPENLQETGFVEFEHDLSEYLVKEKSSDKISKYANRAVHLSEDLITQTIRVEESTLGATSEQLQQQIQQLKPQLERARNRSRQLFDNLRNRLMILSQNFTIQYKAGLEQVSRQARMAVNSYTGALNAEEVARAIESSITPYQQENELNLQQEISKQLARESTSIREELQKIFKSEITATTSNQLMTVTSSESHGLMVRPQSFQLDHVSTDDTSLIGGGLILGGLILMVNVPFIAIPVAIFGGKHFLRQFEDYQRENFLSNVRHQVMLRYNEIIPQQEEKFKVALDSQFANIVDTLRREIDGKISAVESQLEQLLDEHRRTERDENTRRAELKSIEQEIQAIQGKLAKMI